MDKYLLNIPKELKDTIKELATKEGYSLNAKILLILWEYVESKTKVR